MHRTSHLELLIQCELGSSTDRVDAIVVPTHRPAGSLDFAISLARHLACPILVLCSGDSGAAQVARQFHDVTGAAATIATTPEHLLLELPTQRPHTSLAQPYRDTGNKRNVGLMVAHMLGWRRVLFLDDDIFDLTAADVGRAAVVMAAGRMGAVGWRYLDFPDNSVVCHARRYVGHEQDVFLGAGALLVNVTAAVPFFPSVYNEDWLFWHDLAVHRRLGDTGEMVRQRRFNPFADERRARQEEFGDVLAEGLYALIHERRSVRVGRIPGYWKGVMADRRAVLDDVEKELSDRSENAPAENRAEVDQVRRSMAAARQTLNSLIPEDFARFVSDWRDDLDRWNALLPALRRFDRIADALAFLKIADVHLLG